MDISIHRVTSIELKNSESLGGNLEYIRKIVIKAKTIEGEPTESIVYLFGSEDALEVKL